MKARLILEDGTVFTGTSFGAEGESVGEVVFNTSMTGYQEILTDPSYCGQIITMTYPLIGNYGFNRDDNECLRSFAHGLVVREYQEFASNWRNETTISDWLKEQGIIGISGIDTRALTRKLRIYGVMRGLLTTSDEPVEVLIDRLKNTPHMHDQVARVSTKSIYISPNYGKRVVLMDFGAKHNIQRELVERNCEVISVPYNTTAEEILRFRPDGIMLSNGPGDPKDVPEVIETIEQLIGKVPMFGICLGHQLIALACGADTAKLKFGHRGGNHPVKELETGRTVITSQNHGYAVTHESLAGTDLEVTHIALNDGTIEGLKHKTLPVFSVQYHPESAPGPLDSGYLFDQFKEMMDAFNKKGEKIHA
ncbi:glutamine-hydrolyzing carbamoyl-phosphate synthase small subunit [Thermoflavimicrobium dichotomicum]|uniref:Carbamoyl phosphate synthase small chain n=1 Tax=Thermoflavimicrobium dichotomicum TaxID=46223 RepID=A0A1I3SVK1_9BACL|nr:glutamine-hydrolyzing carbamoyl-phosphate synthase small subunit [Thermoflavimicrobium dichotomicum]SFJ62825.1 carbamoyl-phosphate synthase small subunit [Thermoflavimicrobium dichotomicum]